MPIIQGEKMNVNNCLLGWSFTQMSCYRFNRTAIEFCSRFIFYLFIALRCFASLCFVRSSVKSNGIESNRLEWSQSDTIEPTNKTKGRKRESSKIFTKRRQNDNKSYQMRSSSIRIHLHTHTQTHTPITKISIHRAEIR